MTKRFFPLVFLAAAGFSFAQDMPPLPPLPNQTTTTAPADNSAANAAAPALPPLPDQAAAPANNSGNGAPAVPPLPDQNAAPANAPAQAGTTQASPEMPPLPGQQAAPATEQAPAPAPADQGQVTAAPEATPAPNGEAKPAKKSTPQPWWTKTKHRSNVIFGGWVNAKGGNESSRIAWTSQEVMNALVFKGYKVIKEDGKYDGQEGAGGNQWRELTFSIPKSKLTTQVYMKQVGKKVWLRVGPSEPPAFENHSVGQVQKIREANLKALHLVQKKLGRRISPHRIIRSWEAPYSYSQEAVVE